MSQNNSNVGIVVLSWNDPKNTIELVDSIFESDYQNFDVVIVDNNSIQEKFDTTLNDLRKKNYNFQLITGNEKFNLNQIYKKKVFVIRSTEVANYMFAENVGVSRGYNKGINFVIKNNYDYVVKLDCDFIISKNLISGLIKTFDERDNVIAVSPKVYYYKNNKTKIIWWKGVNFSKNYFRFQRTGKGANRKEIDNGQFSGVTESEGICGCCVMIKKRGFIEKGMLDNDFFFGPEDIEHAFRLRKIGLLLVNLDYHAYHKVSQSIFISGVKKRIYFETIGWLTLINKVCNYKDRIIGYIYFLIRGISHFIRYLVSENKDAHLGFVLGLKDFFRKKL